MNYQNVLKYIFLLSFCAAFSCPALAQEDILHLKDVGIAKYAVIEVAKDYAPIRIAPDTEAARYSNLRKGVVLYADKQNNEYYRIDLGENKPYWIEKRYADVQAIIPDKRIPAVNKINFTEDKNNYYVQIPSDIQTSYKITETPTGLDFKLYDVKYDKNVVEINNKISKDSDSKFSIILNGDSSPIFSVDLGHSLFGYDVSKEDNGLILNIKKPIEIDKKNPLKNVKIALDAGHGGDERGVVANGHMEKDVNLKITKYLNKNLRKRGAKTLLIRKRDVNVDLYDRVSAAKEKKTDLLISIHQNSLPDPSKYELKHGVGTYYYNAQAKPLALAIKNSVVRQTGFKDDGVTNASFVITRATEPVAVLVECGYLIHPYEAKMLTGRKFQKLMAKSVADGIEDYLRNLK